jgi:branched-subunit amino acid permease
MFGEPHFVLGSLLFLTQIGVLSLGPKLGIGRKGKEQFVINSLIGLDFSTKPLLLFYFIYFKIIIIIIITIHHSSIFCFFTPKFISFS